MKKKLIAVIFIIAIFSILTTVFFWLLPAEEKPKLSPLLENTLYVQSSLSRECRAIITSILDGVASTPSEVPCKVQSLSKN